MRTHLKISHSWLFFFIKNICPVKCSKCKCHLFLPELINIQNNSTSMSPYCFYFCPLKQEALSIAGSQWLEQIHLYFKWPQLCVSQTLLFYILQVILVDSTEDPQACLAQRSQKLQLLNRFAWLKWIFFFCTRTAQGVCEWRMGQISQLLQHPINLRPSSQIFSYSIKPNAHGPIAQSMNEVTAMKWKCCYSLYFFFFYTKYLAIETGTCF